LNTGLEIIGLLKELNRELGVTVITNTHDLKVIEVSDRIAWLSDGEFQRIEDKIEVAIGPGDAKIPFDRETGRHEKGFFKGDVEVALG
ncbi:MAG: hypothetical protein ACP5SK_03140, partial [Thermoprotei archaeon]